MSFTAVPDLQWALPRLAHSRFGTYLRTYTALQISCQIMSINSFINNKSIRSLLKDRMHVFSVQECKYRGWVIFSGESISSSCALVR